jgi:hypothetical protein
VCTLRDGDRLPHGGRRQDAAAYALNASPSSPQGVKPGRSHASYLPAPFRRQSTEANRSARAFSSRRSSRAARPNRGAGGLRQGRFGSGLKEIGDGAAGDPAAGEREGVVGVDAVSGHSIREKSASGLAVEPLYS